MHLILICLFTARIAPSKHSMQKDLWSPEVHILMREAGVMQDLSQKKEATTDSKSKSDRNWIISRKIAS